MTTHRTPMIMFTLAKRLSASLVFFAAASSFAQAPAANQPPPDPLAMAQAAIAKQEWAKAESILLPISEAQPRNPFVFYEMARIYENTNRVESARQIYQGLANIPDAQQRQYAVVVRTPEVSYLTSLVSLSQARLNALKASSTVAQAVVPRTATPALTQATSLASAVIPTVVPSPAAMPASSIAITNAIQSWANAWANKEVSAYIAHYVNGYQGSFRSASAWQKQRTEYIKGKMTIALDIADVKVTAIGDRKMQASFKQNYTSDSYADTTSKTLVFVKSGERWLIERESVTH